MMTRMLSFFACLLMSALLLVACDSNTPLPTLHPTVDSGNTNATVDPNLGSGFDPNLGGDDNNTDTQPTPTRESGSTVSGDTESGARGTGFTAQITGGSIANITDGGQYACNLNGHMISAGVNPAPNIVFTLPATNAVGSHTFITADSQGDTSVQVSLASVDDSYSQVTGGTLTIDEIPQEAGEFVSGSFDFTIKNASGAEIGIVGEFDFETGNTAYCS
jgi:hypothetical protein